MKKETAERIVVVIDTNYHARNFESSDVFEKMSEKYETFLFVRKSVITSNRYQFITGRANREQYDVTDKAPKFYSLLRDCNANMAKRENPVLVMSDRWRHPRFVDLFHQESFTGKDKTSIYKEILSTLIRSKAAFTKGNINQFLFIGKSLLRRMLIKVLCTTKLYALLLRMYVKASFVESDIYIKLSKVEPSLVVCISNLDSSFSAALVKFCRESKFKSMLVAENWDNIVSKYKLWELSDYMGVWGQQTRKWAIEFQGFKPERVKITGSPRIEYFRGLSAKKSNKRQSQYLSFVGASVPCDELSLVPMLQNQLKDLNGLGGQEFALKVRPYPWRDATRLITLCNQLGIELSCDAIQMQNELQQENPLSPNIPLQRRFLDDSDVVISGPSTVIFESLLLGKKCILLAYQCCSGINDYSFLWKYNEWFHDLVSHPNLTIVHERSELSLAIKLTLRKPIQEKAESTSEIERYIYGLEENLTYSQNLMNCIEEILC